MEKSIEQLTSRWNLVRSALFFFVVITFSELPTTLPADLILIAAFGSGLGILFGGWSLFKGDWFWGRAALLVGGVMLIASMLIQIVSRAILQALPGLLLAYVMLIFSAEAFDLTSQQYGMYSKNFQGPQASYVMLQKSMEHMTRKIVRLGLIFGGCYVIALTVISVGDAFVTALPQLSDISLYIVAVSVSLALLLILRED